MKSFIFRLMVSLAVCFAPLGISAQDTPTDVMLMTKIDLNTNPNARVIATKGKKNSQYTTVQDFKTYATQGLATLAKLKADSMELANNINYGQQQLDAEIVRATAAEATKADAAHTHSYNALTNLPTLFDGNYNSLSNKPAIPDISGKADVTALNTVLSKSDTRDDSLKNAINQKMLSISGQNLTLSGANTVVLPYDATFSVNGTNIKGGATAFLVNTTGSNNIAIGNNTLKKTTTQSFNIAIGSNALQNAASTNQYSGEAQSNTAIGYNALGLTTTGGSNTAIGKECLSVNTTGSRNSAIGEFSMSANTTGNNNFALGMNSLIANTTGNNNFALGNNAGGITTGNNNVVIGVLTTALSQTTDNQLAIGSNGIRWITGVSGAITIPVSLATPIVNVSISKTPTSTTDTSGAVGDIARDNDYFYVKTSTGWKRSALSTF